jgi:hypothetical protein
MSIRKIALTLFLCILYKCNNFTYTHVTINQYTPPANHCLEGIFMRTQQGYGALYYVPIYDSGLHYSICLFAVNTGTCVNYTESALSFIPINKDLTDPTSNTLCSLNVGRPKYGYATFFYINNTDVNKLDYQYVFFNTVTNINPSTVVQMPTPNLTAILGPGIYINLVSNCKESYGSISAVPFYYGILCTYQVVQQNTNTSLFFLGVSHFNMDAANAINYDYSLYFSDYLLPNKGYGNYFNRRSVKLLNSPTTKVYIFVTVDPNTNTFYINYTNQDPLITYPSYSFTIPETILTFYYDWSGYCRMMITAIISTGGSEYLKFWFMDVTQYNNATGTYDYILNPPANIVTSVIPHFDSGYHEFAMVKILNEQNSNYFLINVFSTNTVVLDWTNESVSVYHIISSGQFFAIFDILFVYDNSILNFPVIYQDAYYLYGYTYESGDIVNGIFKITGCLFRAANAYNTYDNSKCREFCLFHEIYNVANKSCDRCPQSQYINTTTQTCVLSCPNLPLMVTDNILMACYYCSLISEKYQDGVCVPSCTVYNYIDYGPNCDLCPVGQYNYQSTCVNSCPYPYGKNSSDRICYLCANPNPYWYNGSCYSLCPVGLGADTTNVCIDCATISMNISNGLCVSQCPNGLGLDKKTNTCIDCYTQQLFLELNNCVSKCTAPNGLNKTNNTCINCATILRYNYNAMCTPQSNLPQGYIVTDAVYNVVNTCKNQNMYIYNGNCVNPCPSGTSLTVSTNTCDTSTDVSCSQGSIYYNNACVECISINQVFYNNGCMLTCPTNYTPDSSGICQLTTTCTAPNIFKFNNQCLHTCSNGLVTDYINYICIDCQTTGQIAYDNECLDNCPSAYINVNGSCTSCIKSGLFLYNNQCATTCPADTIPINSICTESVCTNTICNGGDCSILFNQVTCACPANKMGVYCQFDGNQIEEANSLSNTFINI